MGPDYVYKKLVSGLLLTIRQYLHRSERSTVFSRLDDRRRESQL